MSFDLFAQTFDDSIAISRSEIIASLRSNVAGEPDEGFCRTRTEDGGEADFYVGDSGSMVNHFSPGDTMELIVQTASSHGLTLLGPQLPVMLTDPGQLEQVPDHLASSDLEPVLVASGTDLDGLIAGDEETYRRCRRRLEASVGK